MIIEFEIKRLETLLEFISNPEEDYEFDKIIIEGFKQPIEITDQEKAIKVVNLMIDDLKNHRTINN